MTGTPQQYSSNAFRVANDYNRSDGFKVTIYARDGLCDRTHVYGWHCGHNKSLAERLVRAIEAGKVLTSYTIALDVDNRTYVAAQGLQQVMGWRMNADLRRLGY
jgi:hypothetical protein